MNLKLLSDNFEMLADAPDGVPKLREMILQLAVRGKLVVQDPNDEPAFVLLDKIKAEKERLIKEKKIRKTKPLEPIETDETPFALPNGWEWCKLEQISNVVHYGYTASADENIKDVRLLRITDIQNGKVNWDTVPGCEISDEKINYYKLNNGDMLIARTGGTIGKTFLVNDIPVCAVFASYLIRVVPTNPFIPEFLKLFSGSPLYWKQLYAKCSGTGQPNVNATSLKGLAISVPPLTEQKRIVTKVNQLMSLCDELEARKQKSDKIHIALNDAALDKLLSAKTPKTFTKHWQRIRRNFDLLFDNPENVSKLRQAILQLAVQGKLVPQNPDDEPASVLLEKIKAEKERLIKAKMIRKMKPLAPIELDEVPYGLPKNWQWVRVRDITHDLGQEKPKSRFTYIDVSSINNQIGIISDNIKIIEPDKAPLRARKIVTKGTVIYSTVRPYLLNIAIVEATYKPKPIVSTAFAVLHPFSGVLNKFLFYYLRSAPFINFVESEMSGMAYPAISDTKFNRGIIPLPPSNEQQRIVAKVDQLMSICNELEVKLSQSQSDCDKMLSAIVF